MHPSRAIRIGCSGWHYASWRGRFYDPALRTDDWLDAYARVFDTVELNNSFYRLPPAEQFVRWRSRVPRGFLFAVKASRYITHLKRLRDPDEPLARLLDRAGALGPALGPILFQLPPRWSPDPARLETFLDRLPHRPGSRPLRYVLELREPSAYTPALIRMLRAHDVALCVHDMAGSEAPRLATSRLVYVRLHGFGARYGGSYPDEVLGDWASWIRTQHADGRRVHVYFNNDVDAHAVRDAMRLKAMVEAAGTPHARRARSGHAISRTRAAPRPAGGRR